MPSRIGRPNRLHDVQEADTRVASSHGRTMSVLPQRRSYDGSYARSFSSTGKVAGVSYSSHIRTQSSVMRSNKIEASSRSGTPSPPRKYPQ